MCIMPKINSKTFSKSLLAAVVSHGKLRDSIQDLCVFSMTQASQGNYTYVNEVMNADFAGADQRAMQKYFEDHNDITLGRKDGKFAFTNNKSKGFKYTAAVKTWWTYKPTAAPAVVDPVGLLMGVIKRIESGIAGTNGASLAKGTTVAAAKRIVAAIKGDDDVKAHQLAAAIAKAS
jgi:hypothetical protein